MSKITWLGHAAFKIETKKYTFFIDPWINGNPVSSYKSHNEIKKADFVLVTHDHSDHGFDDAVEICKNTGATFIGVYELAQFSGEKGCNFIGGNIGGQIQFGDAKIYFAPALHSSTLAAPCGFIVSTPEITIYHTGDTAFYSDMQYLSKLYSIDVMMLPICSKYMMGITEAVWAVEKVQPKHAIPCHYNTFDGLSADAGEFKEKATLFSNIEVFQFGEEKEIKI